MQFRPRREERYTRALATMVLGMIAVAALIFLGLRLLVAEPRFVSQPAATPAPAAAVPEPTRAPTPSGPRPPVADTAMQWVAAWREGRHADMYRMLSAGARAGIAEDRFTGRYEAVADGTGLLGIDATMPAMRDPADNVARFDARFAAKLQTARFGELNEEYVLPLVFEEGAWKVEWTPDLILPGLAPDRLVRVFADDPVRGPIVDRNGKPLATMGRLPTLGVIPGGLADRDRAIAEIAGYMQVDPQLIRAQLDAAQPDWWVPLGTFSADKREELVGKFGEMNGVLVEEQASRVYPEGSAAAHVVGYVAPALDDEMETLRARGYLPGEVVGKAGIEASQEEALAGARGGRLIITDAEGNTVREVAERPAAPGQTVQLTIDIEIQKRVEGVLGERLGSIVLMDPRDNSVLAMASNPRFDPNGFVVGFSTAEWQRLTEDESRPFHNRPAVAAYPTGSIFKVITTIAGLERGGFNPNSGFNCPGSWNIPNTRIVMGDWVPEGHGAINLSNGLTQSCNIVFYEVGKKLYEIDQQILNTYAKQFGLGEPTGINGIVESPGILPGPEWKEKTLEEPFWLGDNVNLAIGQGYLEATALQMANVYSVLANGGTLRTPLLISRIGPTTGAGEVKEFQSQERGRVQASPQTMAMVRQSLHNVTRPGGTATGAFAGFPIPTAGKTGSAENQHGGTHAWFGGFAPVDSPQVVVLAMAEGGMGGAVAAPMGRQALEVALLR